MTDREQLERLVKLAEQFRRTPIVDDDFPAYRNAFDDELTRAREALNRTAGAPPAKTGKSVLQSWVQELGLRHQGVLLAAVRGCDTAPKEDASKDLTRAYRGYVLNAFVGDAVKSTSFIEAVDLDELRRRGTAFRKNRDHYPCHWVLHMTHAIEVLGYKHPDPAVRGVWRDLYVSLCRGLHVTAETESELDARLTANEAEFGAANKA